MDSLWFRRRHSPCLHSPKTSLASGFCLQNIICHTVQGRSKYHIHLVVIETEVGKKKGLPLAHQSRGRTWSPCLFCLSLRVPVPYLISHHWVCLWCLAPFLIPPGEILASFWDLSVRTCDISQGLMCSGWGRPRAADMMSSRMVRNWGGLGFILAACHKAGTLTELASKTPFLCSLGEGLGTVIDLAFVRNSLQY